MDSDSLPGVSSVDLKLTLSAAERLAAHAEQVTDLRVQRLLRVASCELLDAALTAAADPHWRPGRNAVSHAT